MVYKISDFLLMFAYLFFLGSILGYLIEVIYRKFAPDNKTHKWVNPGFCIGPYLPIYGIAVCILFALANVGNYFGWTVNFEGRIFLFIFMALVITVMEYFAGEICINVFHVRLWDYRNEFLNLKGHICLKFTFFWWLLSAGYYFILNQHMRDAVLWLNNNIGFLFVVGFFFGVFSIDFIYSGNLMLKIKEFASNNDLIVAYEKVVEYAKEEFKKVKNLKNVQFERFSASTMLDQIKKVEKKVKDKLK